MRRTHARSPKGQAAYAVEPYKLEEKVNLLSALSLNGVIAPYLIRDGSVDTDVLLYYAEHILCPELRAGDMLVLDNYPIHKANKLETLVEQRGASILFLPTYSPDFNPIELAFSKLKAHLKKLAADTFDDLSYGIKRILDSIALHEIIAWFRHCGYVVP